MKTAVRTAVYAAFLGLCLWVVDAIFHLRQSADTTFTGALLTDAPAERLYLRGLVLLSLLVFGWIIGSAADRESRAERHMRNATRRLDLILESTHEGVFGIDVEGRFSFVNDAAASMLGYDVDELMGQNVHTVIHHSSADGTPYPPEECPVLDPSRIDGDARVLDEVFWRSDGAPLPVHYSARPMRESGERRGTVVVFHDISPEQVAHQELERLRRLSQLILKWAGEGIFGIDRHRRITFVNPAAAMMLGYEREELIGREAHPLLQHTREDGTAHPQSRSLIYAALDDNDVYHVSDEVFVRSDGGTLPVEYTATPLREGDELAGAVVVFKDITERKTAEKDLRQTLDELARSNRELEIFAYVVSHDLQEPLRMVQSYVQLLERRYAEQLDGDARDFIDFAVDGTRRMQKMIEDLLAYSRVDSRGADFSRVDLNDALDDALANLAASIDETGARIQREEMPELAADRGQMVQLLQNLIGNAIKFRGDEPPVVRISAEERDGAWVIAVEDNGIGIPEQQGDRIFAIFQRLHRPESYPGTGIGLSICRKIVERHGGSIHVESTAGEGSTFYVELPAREREPAAPGRMTEASHPGE